MTKMHCLWWNKSVSNWITTCSFIQTGNYSLDWITWSKLRYFNWKSSMKYLHRYFHHRSSSTTTRRSPHAKEQEWSELKVNQVASTRKEEEERTKVLHDNEEKQSQSLQLKEQGFLTTSNQVNLHTRPQYQTSRPPRTKTTKVLIVLKLN